MIVELEKEQFFSRIRAQEILTITEYISKPKYCSICYIISIVEKKVPFCKRNIGDKLGLWSI